MGGAKGWIQEQTGRSAMRSPGRPEINQRLIKQAFWEHISAGLQSEDAARACGVSQSLGPIGYIPPAEAEENYCRQLASQAVMSA